MELLAVGPLGELQVKLLRVLWRAGPAPVAELTTAVHALCPGSTPCYVTVLTVLRRMERRGLVRHTRRGLSKRDQAFVYHAAVTEAAVREALLRDMAGSLFDGFESLKAFVATLA